MTSERARAYGRVISTIDDLAASKLHPDEAAILREAADALLFTDAVSAETEDAVLAVGRLLTQLEESGRWTAERCRGLAHDLVACGPTAALTA